MNQVKLAGLILGSVAVIAVAPHVPKSRNDSAIPVDGTAWKKSDKENVRLRMIEDLKPKLIGLSKERVRELRGEPEGNFCPNPGDYYSYIIGVKMRLGDTDGIYLNIRFKNNRAEEIIVNQG